MSLQHCFALAVVAFASRHVQALRQSPFALRVTTEGFQKRPMPVDAIFFWSSLLLLRLQRKEIIHWNAVMLMYYYIQSINQYI